MAVEIVAGILASSLALLSDAGAHADRRRRAGDLARGGATGDATRATVSMTYGLGRAEILSAQANGLTLLVLAVPDRVRRDRRA